jgi:glutaminyl-tRNA synthetase
LYIEQDDFRQSPPPKYYRLYPGNEVRLRYAYFIRCVEAVTDPNTGEIIELHCTYDPSTRGGDAPDGRKVKSTIHWVSAAHALPAQIRLYDRLFNREDPEGMEEGQTFLDCLNPDSLEVLEKCYVEPSLAGAKSGEKFQFERQGYFCIDPDSKDGELVFNRTVALRDSWAKEERKLQGL